MSRLFDTGKKQIHSVKNQKSQLAPRPLAPTPEVTSQPNPSHTAIQRIPASSNRLARISILPEEPLQIQSQTDSVTEVAEPGSGIVQRKATHFFQVPPIDPPTSQYSVMGEPIQAKPLIVNKQGQSQPDSDRQTHPVGLPNSLQTGIENLSGLDMSSVQVHYNSSKPSTIGAAAYTQGSNIHIGPGQERHLPHEAWHVVQQKQGRVKPTRQMKGLGINDSDSLEREADRMGSQAMQAPTIQPKFPADSDPSEASQLKPMPIRPTQTAPSNFPFPIQRKAYIGDNYQELNDQFTDSKVQSIVNDNKVRRFKNEQELRAYAQNTTDHIGLTQEGDWLRVDQFTVFGEDHGKQLAPKIISAIKTKRYRYEGFVRQSSDRLKKDWSLALHTQEREQNKLNQLGLAPDRNQPDDRTHEAEDVVPKYARVLPDIIELVKQQSQGGSHQKIAGTSWGNGYTLETVLIQNLLDILIYTRSYSTKSYNIFCTHRLKKFYKQYKQQMEQSIFKLIYSETKNKVPDFSQVQICPYLPKLKDIYLSLAKSKTNLKKNKDRESFKKKLKLEGETDVAITDEAKEADYLRDYSMFQHIKKSKKSGDLLFTIGDAHRHKLAPLLSKEGIHAIKDHEFIKEEKQKNLDAPKGLTPSDRVEIDEIFNIAYKLIKQCKSKRVKGLHEKYIKKDLIFELKPLPKGGTWQCEGAEALSDRQFKITESTLKVFAVWANNPTEKKCVYDNKSISNISKADSEALALQKTSL